MLATTNQQQIVRAARTLIRVRVGVGSSVAGMGMRMTKPWVELSEQSIAALPAQLGVYEIADAAGSTTTIGYAGGTEPFGMRTALTRELEDGGALFRHEFTHGYLTRWQELLMIHKADHGDLPAGNADTIVTLGRLSPGGN